MNVGARSISSGQNFPSKAALKRAVAADPTDVLFYSTSAFTPGDVRASELTIFSEPLYVVGPDPFTSRKFYATVDRKEVRGYPQTRVS